MHLHHLLLRKLHIVEQLIEDQEPNAEITTGPTYRRMIHSEDSDFAAKVFRLLRGEP